MLSSKNIKTVLTVAKGLPLQYGQDIHHRVYQALDTESYRISKHFMDSFHEIEAGLKRGNVLGKK
jgi:hypothetical protein